MKTIAIIPARGGSVGVKDKNLQKVGGLSLVGRTVRDAKEAGFERILVLTDSEPIREEAMRYGADGSFIRPDHISGGRTHMFEVYKWIFKEMLLRDEQIPNSFCCMLCTTPFRRLDTLIEAKSYLDSGEYDWVLSVNEFEHHPYRGMLLNNDGLLTPAFNVANSLIWANRQELPIYLRFNGGVIGGLTRHVMNNSEYNISFGTDLRIKSLLMTQEESLDIDTNIDLSFARFLSPGVE